MQMQLACAFCLRLSKRSATGGDLGWMHDATMLFGFGNRFFFKRMVYEPLASGIFEDGEFCSHLFSMLNVDALRSSAHSSRTASLPSASSRTF